jgi:ubiquitin C-terminal hydrolase
MKCESTIRKRIPLDQHEVRAECHQCKATYTITDEGNNKITWTPNQQEIECANPDCHEKIFVWLHELEVGRHWKCSKCNGENTFVLAISYKDTAKDNIK